MYKIGDYVYFETSSTSPYQIRRIEELAKGPNGEVEAKVQCFYRRRDLPDNMLDSFTAREGREDEDDPLMCNDTLTVPIADSPSLTPATRHRLCHREVFLSRNVEQLPAAHIRGKCNVVVLDGLEESGDYLGRDDCFFYSLVYDSNQATLVADRGKIRVGAEYQAQIPDMISEEEQSTDRQNERLASPIFLSTISELSDRQIEQFLVLARSVGTFARALDVTSAAKDVNLLSAAILASRDNTQFYALSILHSSEYDLNTAIARLAPAQGEGEEAVVGPLMCRDQSEEWSAEEASMFGDAMERYGKDFRDINREVLPWKKICDIVEYYYMWKTTDRYVVTKKLKAIDAERRLKQVFIPVYNRAHPAAVTPLMAEPMPCGQTRCAGCDETKSQQWYSWGPASQRLRLCKSCWHYWKRYGGLPEPHEFELYNPSTESRSLPSSTNNSANNRSLACPECRQGFDSITMLAQHLDAQHPMQRCPMKGCGRSARGTNALKRHLQADHGVGSAVPLSTTIPRSSGPQPISERTLRVPFLYVARQHDRVCRRVCSDLTLYRARRHTRVLRRPVGIESMRSAYETAPKAVKLKALNKVTRTAGDDDASQVVSRKRDMSAIENGHVENGNCEDTNANLKKQKIQAEVEAC